MKTLVLTIYLAASGTCMAQPFAIDTSFKVHYPFHLQVTSIYGIIEEPDGAFLLHGRISDINSQWPQHAVKFLPDGTLDTTFKVWPYPGNPIYYAKRTDYGYFLARSGLRKADFVTGRIIDSAQQSEYITPLISCMALNGGSYLSDQGIFWGGISGTGPCSWTPPGSQQKRNYWLFRLTHDMQMDTSFTLGEHPHNMMGGVHYIVPYNDSLLLVGGWFWTYAGEPVNCLIRIDNHSGIRDTNFKSIFTICDLAGKPYIDNEGRIIVHGRFKIQGYDDTLIIARLMPDGSLDTTFNRLKEKIAPASEPYNLGTATIAPTDDGGYLIGGSFTDYDGHARGCIVKTDANGYVDTNYFTGTGLEHRSNTIGLRPQVYSISRGNNSTYYITGYFDTYNGLPVPPVIRLHGLKPDVPDTNYTSPIMIYPNPATDLVHIKVAGAHTEMEMTVGIFDLTGRLVKQYSVSGREADLDVSILPNGVYLVSVRAPGWAGKTEKLVIQR